MCLKDVVRYDYESVTCGSTCPRCVVVKIARGFACGSTCPIPAVNLCCMDPHATLIAIQLYIYQLWDIWIHMQHSYLCCMLWDLYDSSRSTCLVDHIDMYLSPVRQVDPHAPALDSWI